MLSPLAPSFLTPRFLIFLVTGFLASSSLIAQPFGFLTWNTADGLPQSQVTALAEDDRGFLWAGTQGGGVARFDGEEFTIYTTAEGLPDNFVRHLWLDETRNLFAVTGDGVARYNVRADRWEKSDTQYPEKAPLYDLFPGFTNPVDALNLADGRFLLATRSNGLYLIDGDRQTILHHYTENNSDLPHNSVRTLLRDRQGRFWLGTSGGGLVRMIPTGIRHYDRADGLIGDRVYALHESRGRLWLSASKRGMQYLDSSGFQRPAVADPTVGTKITGVTGDRAGRFTFFSTDGKGVFVLDDSLRLERLTARSGLPSDWVMKMLPGTNPSTDDAWAITYTEGLANIVYRDSAFQIDNYNLPEEQRPLRLAAAIRKEGGDFFLGTTTGRIHRWKPRAGRSEMQTTAYGPENGLPDAPVKALALRRGTQLWAAVTGHGLFYTDLRMAEVRFFPLPSRLKTSTNIFQLTAPPDRPEVWIGTERGVDRLFLDSDGRPDYLRSYGRAEGFSGGETTGASLIDSTGAIWFGTMNGLARYEEAETESYLAPPATFLEGIDLFYTPIDSASIAFKNETPHLRPRQNHLNFRYRAVDLTYPERIRYRYKLTGLDGTDWSPLTKETAVRFAGLSAGNHTFSVAATTDGGKTFGEPVAYSFAIENPLVRQAWFLGLVALLASGLLIGGFYAFYRRGQQKEAVKRRRLEARNQVLELEQKALRLQMNPHFIFNALNGIRGLVDGKHDVEARDQISRFATLMRGILNNSREETITLADEVKVLEDYLKMEQFCQPFPFTFTITLPEGVDPEEVSMPPMLLQPFVENAVLHGLSGRENAGHIDVIFSLRGRRMRCLVADNGIGREAAALRRQSRAPGHKSVALDVTRARLQAMKGKLSISDRDGGGTTVEVVVPVETW